MSRYVYQLRASFTWHIGDRDADEGLCVSAPSPSGAAGTRPLEDPPTEICRRCRIAADASGIELPEGVDVPDHSLPETPRVSYEEMFPSDREGSV